MRPFLTSRGKWVFAAAACFTVVGVVMRRPMVVLFAQIPFGLLVLALATLLPAARCLDRRDARLWIEQPDGDRGVCQLRRRHKRGLSMWVENRSTTPIYLRRLEPLCTGPVGVDGPDEAVVVRGGKRRRVELGVDSQGIGRSALQGFDVQLVDRWSLLSIHDYLPCLQVFETRPTMASGRVLRRRARPSRRRAERAVNRRNRSGTRLRELRDFQPGDPLRSIAWKSTVRHRRLITREFDDERQGSEYVALDISSTMRAGTSGGEKFDHAIEVVARLCGRLLDDDRQVGLLTFDESIYGRLSARRGRAQSRRIRSHLTSLRSVVDPERTALDDTGLREMLADYLLIQERLDFREGGGLSGEVDARLFRDWLEGAVERDVRRWNSLVEGSASRSGSPTDPARRLLRLRGIPLAPNAEVSTGAKTRGIAEVVESVIREASSEGRLTVVTDLCGVGDIDGLEQPIGLARRRGISIRFFAPFTPDYGKDIANGSSRRAMLRKLFSIAEQRDRSDVAVRLAGMGVPVRFIGP